MRIRRAAKALHHAGCIPVMAAFVLLAGETLASVAGPGENSIDIALQALTDKRPVDANAAFAKAAMEGNAAVQGALGVMYYDGIGVPVDAAKAFYWLSKADAQGRPEASYRLGLMYGNSDPLAGAPAFDRQTSDNYLAKAWNGLDPLIKKNDAMAEATAARFLIPDYDSITDHLGIPKDAALAERLLKAAAAQGDIDAMEMLATLYDLDRGKGRAQGRRDGLVFKDTEKEALGLHEHAGLLGHSRAMERVGKYFSDTGDDKKAVAWLTAAAKLGDRYASTRLGQRYGISIGTPFADSYSEPPETVAGTKAGDIDPVLVSMAIVGLVMAIAIANPATEGEPSADTELYADRLRDERNYWEMRQSQDDFACTIGGGTPNWGGGCD